MNESQRQGTATRWIATAFAVSALGAFTLAGTYVAGGQPQVEGASLAVCLAGLGTGLIVWAARLLPEQTVIGPREPLHSTAEEREEFAESFDPGEEMFGRRRFLLRMLTLAAGALGVAALFPIRSLGPSPGNKLKHTAWRKGSRVMNQSGKAVKVGDLDVGGVLTVFPEGHLDAANAQTLLIRVGDDEVKARPGRETWSPEGYIAYSKVCTHAGCPVGLYRTDDHQLLCPCHQSTFDVLDGAKPVFGPAARSLPQLPLRVDESGYLVAQDDYDEPIGPSFWNRS